MIKVNTKDTRTASTLISLEIFRIVILVFCTDRAQICLQLNLVSQLDLCLKLSHYCTISYII